MNDRREKMNAMYVYTPPSEKASASVRGSVTVEAAMAIPLFFFCIICFLYLMEMSVIQTSVRAGLSAAEKEIAVEAYALPVVVPTEVEKKVVQAIGKERLDRSLIMGGSEGIDCGESYISPTTGIGKLVAEYQVELPIPTFLIPSITYHVNMKIKGWTGYENGSFLSDADIFYMTPSGSVYHTDYNCSYLDLSIRTVGVGEVDSLRNKDGGKYYACSCCKDNPSSVVYITDYGTNFHSSLSCSGLKRTVIAVDAGETEGRSACSKCGH